VLLAQDLQIKIVWHAALTTLNRLLIQLCALIKGNVLQVTILTILLAFVLVSL
jgi:hypothetical protein